MHSLQEEIPLDKNKKHDIDLVVDRVVVVDDEKSRIEDSIELALSEGDGVVKVRDEEGQEYLYSSKFACPVCGFSIEEIEPRLFSFNSPYGACPECTGLGFKIEPDPDLIVRDWNLSLEEGAIQIPGFRGFDTYTFQILLQVARKYGIDTYKPLKKLSKDELDIIFYGTEGKTPVRITSKNGETYSFSTYFEGIVNLLKRRYNETESENMKEEYEKFMRRVECPVCHGKRLKPEALAVTVDGINIADLTSMSVNQAYRFFINLEKKLTEKEKSTTSEKRKITPILLAFYVFTHYPRFIR